MSGSRRRPFSPGTSEAFQYSPAEKPFDWSPVGGKIEKIGASPNRKDWGITASSGPGRARPLRPGAVLRKASPDGPEALPLETSQYPKAAAICGAGARPFRRARALPPDREFDASEKNVAMGETRWCRSERCSVALPLPSRASLRAQRRHMPTLSSDPAIPRSRRRGASSSRATAIWLPVSHSPPPRPPRRLVASRSPRRKLPLELWQQSWSDVVLPTNPEEIANAYHEVRPENSGPGITPDVSHAG
jgi:hypothetical protein